MLTLNDGRSELWQWDTGRKLTVDADCSQVHFSNKVFGRSIDVDVVGGVAIIPDVLLQIDNDLTAWAFVGTAENGYTKISMVFKVNKRNKPADYVFTPPEQTTLQELVERLAAIEESQDPDAIKNAVEDYLEQNPVESPVHSVNGKTGEVELTAEDVGAISQDDLQEATNEALAQAKASGEFDGQPGQPGRDGVDGKDGYTPVKGKDYFDGKSAYQYAKDGGYTGTEEEFSEKLAKEYPTKVSELANDAGYLTGYTETDPTVPTWAKAATKPGYSKSEVGLGNVDNVKQYSSNNPPPYPVTKVNGKTGDVELDASDVGALSVSDIVDVLTSTESNKALSARLGFQLNSKLTTLRNEFDNLEGDDTIEVDMEEGTFSHKDSGVAANWYGEQGGGDLNFGDSFTVPGALNIDAKGHITEAKDNQFKLPDNEATEAKKGLLSPADKAKLNKLKPPFNFELNNDSASNIDVNITLFDADEEAVAEFDVVGTGRAKVSRNTTSGALEINVENETVDLSGYATTQQLATVEGKIPTVAQDIGDSATATMSQEVITRKLYEIRNTDIEQTEQIESLSEEIADQQTEIENIKTQGVQQTPSYPQQGDTVEEQLAWLDENGDTTKVYLLADGNLYVYVEKTITTEGGTVANFTNLIDASGAYVKDGYRYSQSSADFKEASTDAAVVVPIPATTDITIRVRGATLNTSLYNTSVYYGTTNQLFPNNGSGPSALSIVKETNGDLTITYDNLSTSNKYVIFHVDSGVDTDALIVTVNEEITYTTTEGGTETVIGWQSTGHAFVPADYEDRIVNLETDNNSLKARVKSLEDSIMTGNAVPEYVLAESEEVADKVLAVRNADSLVMSLASDLHTNGTDASSVGVLHAGQAMDIINSMTQIDLVSLLGDYEIYGFSYGDGDTDGEDARESFKHAKKAFSNIAKCVPFMQLQGNHDELPTDSTETARQKYYAYIGANNVGTVTDYDNKFRNYGYRDFENYKIRVIYLNTADVSDSAVTESYNVSTEQLNWLNTVALNLTDSDWGIIVLSHHPLNWYGMSGLLDALNVYKGKGTGAELIAHFHGHLHNFRVETLGSNEVPSITIPNACFGRNNEYGTSSSYDETIRINYGDTDESGNQRQFNKTANTAEDTAFNVVVVDRQNRKIHCFNYGAGIDRVIAY